MNVPATLDQVIDMLPHMPNQLQLHPLKLKHKLEYKSHYMYDVIRRDRVMGAITWLKEHNPHYAGITVNENWYNSAPSDDLALILLDNEAQYPQHTQHTWQWMDSMTMEVATCVQHYMKNILHILELHMKTTCKNLPSVQ